LIVSFLRLFVFGASPFAALCNLILCYIQLLKDFFNSCLSESTKGILPGASGMDAKIGKLEDQVAMWWNLPRCQIVGLPSLILTCLTSPTRIT